MYFVYVRFENDLQFKLLRVNYGGGVIVRAKKTTAAPAAAVMTGATDYGVSGTQNAQSVVVTDCKLYKRRWPMLLLFVLCSMANAVQWIQYSIISNVIMKFYDVSSFAVDFTSIVYMVTYIPLIFPASWILDRMVWSAHL